jgi:quercetin dioxygenase-like cupin family protein
MDIRRFGIGHRRPEGPAGTHGVSGQSIHADELGLIAELAFHAHGSIAPHENPNLTYFVVIEGGGFVQVGEEVARIAAGEAVVWPPNVIHAAWTELTPMRAIVVEFASEMAAPLLAAGAAAALLVKPGPVGAGDAVEGGGLAPQSSLPPPDRDSPDKEPW